MPILLVRYCLSDHQVVQLVRLIQILLHRSVLQDHLVPADLQGPARLVPEKRSRRCCQLMPD
jgi:hypothetical protein